MFLNPIRKMTYIVMHQAGTIVDVTPGESSLNISMIAEPMFADRIESAVDLCDYTLFY